MSWSEEEYRKAYGIPQTLPSMKAADPFPEPKIVAGIVDHGGRHAYQSGALREGKRSAPHMIATYGLRRVAEHYHAGGVKYERFNMRKGLPFSSLLDSMGRHYWAFLERDESEDHVAAMLWNVLELAWTQEMIKQGRLPASLDDLFTPPEVLK